LEDIYREITDDLISSTDPAVHKQHFFRVAASPRRIVATISRLP